MTQDFVDLIDSSTDHMFLETNQIRWPEGVTWIYPTSDEISDRESELIGWRNSSVDYFSVQERGSHRMEQQKWQSDAKIVVETAEKDLCNKLNSLPMMGR